MPASIITEENAFLLGICICVSIIMIYAFYRIVRILISGTSESEANKSSCKRTSLATAVSLYSEWYKEVLDLQKRTCYYSEDEILDFGYSEYRIQVNSKAKLDKYDFNNALELFVRHNKNGIKECIEHLLSNREALQKYKNHLSIISISTNEKLYQETGISKERFERAERYYVAELDSNFQKLIPLQYSIVCYVTYITPQKKKKYTKQMAFGMGDIQNMLNRIEKKDLFETSEARRREVERSKVTPSVRYDVMRRDSFRCCLCGRSADSGVELEVDHIIPISKGGLSEMNNLQTLCRDCNRGKGSKY